MTRHLSKEEAMFIDLSQHWARAFVLSNYTSMHEAGEAMISTLLSYLKDDLQTHNDFLYDQVLSWRVALENKSISKMGDTGSILAVLLIDAVFLKEQDDHKINIVALMAYKEKLRAQRKNIQPLKNFRNKIR